MYDKIHYKLKKKKNVMSYRELVKYNWYTGFDDTDTVDVVSDIEGEMADITLCCHVFDVLYSMCDVMNAVDVMWLLRWCELQEWM